MQSIDRWLEWQPPQPSPPMIPEKEPTKLTEPNSVSSGSTGPGILEINHDDAAGNASDQFWSWICDRCVLRDGSSVGVHALWIDFNEWSALNGCPAIAVQNEFLQRLQTEFLKCGGVLWIRDSIVQNLMLIPDYEQYFGTVPGPGKQSDLQ